LADGNQLANTGLPATHRWRAITHEEFGSLAKYLEEYKESGRIQARFSHHQVILSRLTNGEVEVDEFEGAEDNFMDIEKIHSILSAQDFALVFFPRSEGMYLQIKYARAEESEFRQMVDTAIIEPIDSDLIIPIRLVTIGRQVSSLDKRIEQAKRLQERPSKRDNGTSGRNLSIDEKHLAGLVREYNQEKSRLLKDPVITTTNMEVAIKKYEEASHIALQKRRRIELTLQIEREVEERYEERYRLEDSIETLDKQLDAYDERLEALEVLRLEIGLPKN
jgi:hypothetical protein